ncbi:RNA polymerase sigma factor [Kitasatospora mediocidica]|uniref:RNA polymerase sigma factor n=1 Tax=Kitasatospora mediocidica TaxID=58352 RepID=UPI000A8C3491|nr:RNA polymerase sigma factor [Kitasatospora mediocidica]
MLGRLKRKAPGRETADTLFGEYYPSLRGRVKAVIEMMCGPGADADGMAQETFTKLYVELVKNPRTVPKTYVVKIAINLATDHLRRRASGEVVVEDFTATPWEQIAEHDGYEEAMEFLDTMQLLTKLPLIQRQVVVLMLLSAVKLR